jgi:hypothetical protein
MYFGKADVVSSYNVSQLHKALLVICLLITLALGIFPGLLSNLL